MSLIQSTWQDSLCIMKLDRPDKRNALNWDLLDQACTALDVIHREVESRDLRCLIIGSTSADFCAGADLKERALMTDEKVVETLEKLQRLMDTVDDFPTPTIAVIEGGAFGGGLELAMACDLRIAGRQSQMALKEVAIGVIPGAGGTQRLPRLIGESRAKEIVLRARNVGGEEAFRIGLVNACVDRPWAEALEWGKQIAQNAPLATRCAKQAIAQGRHLRLGNALAVEREKYLKLLGTEDRKEGLRAFLEKRKPQYTGK